jgi:hypothetical protein
LCGSPRRRAERVAIESQISPDKALENVREADRERKAFFRQTYGIDMMDPQIYDITINTDRLSIGEVVDNLAALAKSHAVPGEEYPEPAPVPSRPRRRRTVVEAGAEDVPDTRQRDALLRSRQSLDEATAADAADAIAWAEDLVASLRALRRVFGQHVKESEGAGGSLELVLEAKPRLLRRVSQIREEHIALQNEMADLLVEIAAQIKAKNVEPGALRERITRAQTSLRLHEARGAELLHEAYVRDEDDI